MGTDRAPQWASHSYPSRVHRKFEKYTVSIMSKKDLVNNTNATFELDLIFEIHISGSQPYKILCCGYIRISLTYWIDFHYY